MIAAMTRSTSPPDTLDLTVAGTLANRYMLGLSPDLDNYPGNARFYPVRSAGAL
jgi:hypothetical protein